MAMVGIPKNSDTVVTGIQAWRKGETDKKTEGLIDIDESEHYIRFSVETGPWTFKAQSN